MGDLQQLKKDIAASIYMQPCTEEELSQRDFLKNVSFYGVQRLVMSLEQDAIYYRGEVLHVYKKWAKKHLTEYELNF